MKKKHHGLRTVKKNGNIEKTEIEEVAWVNDTYSSLFCRRCHRYDCQKHGIAQPRPHFLDNGTAKNVKKYSPCSNAKGACYLSTIVSDKQISKYLKAIKARKKSFYRCKYEIRLLFQFKVVQNKEEK